MINEKEKKLIETLNLFETYNEKIDLLIDNTKNNFELDKILRVDSNKVYGCQSDLWLMGFKEDNKIYFNFFTESIFPKAIVYNILSIINYNHKVDILNYQPNFLTETEIVNYITPVRKKGINSVIEKIKFITNEI